jgi:hypothetical protein
VEVPREAKSIELNTLLPGQYMYSSSGSVIVPHLGFPVGSESSAYNTVRMGYEDIIV